MSLYINFKTLEKHLQLVWFTKERKTKQVKTNFDR